MFANEQIHKRTQFSAVVEQMRFDGWVLAGEVCQRLRNIGATYVHFTVSARVGAQWGWDSQNGHGFFFLVSLFFYHKGSKGAQRKTENLCVPAWLIFLSDYLTLCFRTLISAENADSFFISEISVFQRSNGLGVFHFS
jgi:hypothetical protein